MLTTANEKVWQSNVVRILTPDGTIFVLIDEDAKGNPEQIRVQIGKAGSALAAWTFAFSQLLTMSLQHGVTIEDVIGVLSNTNSDKLVYNRTTPIKSGPAGVVQALMSYNAEKAKLILKDAPPMRQARLWGRSNKR